MPESFKTTTASRIWDEWRAVTEETRRHLRRMWHYPIPIVTDWEKLAEAERQEELRKGNQ